MKDLHVLPKLRDSLSYFYVEHAILEQEKKGVSILNKEGRFFLPATDLAVMLLGPGTNITHAAVRSLAEAGCSILWVGEDATRFYASGTGETRRGSRVLRQAELVSDPMKRETIVRRMYIKRFDEPLEDGLSLQQIRGMEGVRMRNAYAVAARRWGVAWSGRAYDRGNWNNADPVNRALSAANALLNGLCHAAIVSGGYSAALGFIHTGKQLSFVYDIADLYKTEITIPLAFQMTADGASGLEARVRQACRERFREVKLIERILPDIDLLLDIHDDGAEAENPFDSETGLPGPLWPDQQGESAP